jgi:VWFA-related protein
VRKFLIFVAACALAVVANRAIAAEPLHVEFVAIEETPGSMVTTVLVAGPQGATIPGLTPSNVKATLNGVPVQVTDVQPYASAQSPIAVVLVVDVSGSMAGEPIVAARQAMLEFIRTLEPVDIVSILAFETSVRVVEDFTTDRNRLTAAINRLQALGATALYDAVIEGVNKATQAQTRRKLVVLLSDGEATVGLEKRNASIEAARAAGVPVVSIGLGHYIDRTYLDELAQATRGRYLDAPTPGVLRNAYVDLAAYIRQQYVLTLAVPQEIDRTVAGNLVIEVSASAGAGRATVDLGPLPGALPPLVLNLQGLLGGQKVAQPTTLTSQLTPGAVATVEYWLGERQLHATAEPPYAFDLDPAALPGGSHILTVVARDEAGRRVESSIEFSSVPPVVSGTLLRLLLIPLALGFAVLVGVMGARFVLGRTEKAPEESYESRVKPWAGRGESNGAGLPVPLAPALAASRAPPEPERPQGHVVVMHEGKIEAGAKDGIRRFDIGPSPLTIGSSPYCDIVLHDPRGELAGEEARLWVQNGRVMYHRLTTLSAMATEGMTGGWMILESGDCVSVGEYKLIFQSDIRQNNAAEETALDLRAATLGQIWPSLQSDLEAS